MVAHLSRAVGEDGTVIAIDAEAAMIEYLAKHTRELGSAKIFTQKVGFHDPELKPESLDGVLTLDTWHHMSAREAYPRKVYAGLRKGGRFAIIDYSLDAETGPPQSMRLAPSDVVSHLESAGFQAEILTESMPRHYIVVGIKN